MILIRPTPDWRWRRIADMPSFIMSDVPVSPDEVPDRITRERLLPYARRRYGLPVDMPEDVYRAIRSAHAAYDGRFSCEQTAFIYEGYALTGEDGTDDDPVQAMYEAIFFDVRHCLSDVDVVVDFVFKPMLEDMPLNMREFESKVVAYALGGGEFRHWVEYDDSAEIIALRERLARLEAFRLSLVELNLPVGGAWAKTLGQAIRMVRNGTASSEHAVFLEQPGWRRHLGCILDIIKVTQ